MIITLLFVAFLVSVAVSTVVMLLFRSSIDSILRRLIKDDLSRAWSRYLQYAIYVVGIGGGVNVFSYEKYFGPTAQVQQKAELTGERWVLEIYNSVIGTLSSTAMLLFFFFLVALIALVVVRGLELRRPREDSGTEQIGTT